MKIDRQNTLSIFIMNKLHILQIKRAMGALLTWYFIAEATMVTENPKNCIEIASQALDIAQNPRINNYFSLLYY